MDRNWLLWIPILLLLSACAPTYDARYPDTCDVKQADQDGKGYTTGYFPCRLQHTVVKEQAKP